jgi:hypothetical protein
MFTGFSPIRWPSAGFPIATPLSGNIQVLAVIYKPYWKRVASKRLQDYFTGDLLSVRPYAEYVDAMIRIIAHIGGEMLAVCWALLGIFST